ncbi:MAG: bifunctional glutamine amidotransferase/anthranilate phosphoribosyltransferase, partial [Chloroflexi bacterium]|nr:bifunctional glutamine amidotransferase/anthranilate phosphoribosyltransferase [Chloroflexota bacterium]
LVVHGEDGLDEISVTGSTRISELVGGEVRTCRFDPTDWGLSRRSPQEIRGGDATENARITQEVLQGRAGAPREIVLLNAAAALIAGERAGDWAEGLALATQSIDSGAAWEKLEALRELSTRLAE